MQLDSPQTHEESSKHNLERDLENNESSGQESTPSHFAICQVCEYRKMQGGDIDVGEVREYLEKMREDRVSKQTQPLHAN